MTGTYQGMRDLVQQRIAYLIVGVLGNEVRGEFNTPRFTTLRVETDAGAPDVRVEAEFPRGKTVRIEQCAGPRG